MNRTSALRLVLTTAIVSAGGIAAHAYAPSNDGLDRTLTIFNSTPFTMVQLDATNGHYQSWPGVDYLGPEFVKPGESLVVDLDDGVGSCDLDLRAVFEGDAGESVAWDVNVCERSEYQFD